MAVKKVGTLIREARTAKKLSQEELASGVDGLSGSDIGKAERGEKELTQTQLKLIAKILGVTQKSLLEAPKGGSTATAKKTAAAKTASATAKKTASAKTTSAPAKKTAAAKTSSATAKKTTAAKTTSATAKKTTAAKAASSAAKKVTASGLSTAEQKLVELYRAANTDERKLATKILKGERLEMGDLLPMLMANAGDGSDGGILGGILGKLQDFAK